jgi:acetoin utilization deacetylase AcuC-like enzyme
MDLFRPEFILVSAGFDAHENDLLGQLNYSGEGYKHATDILLNIAKQYSSGRMMFVLEGGYESQNIQESSEKVINALITYASNKL